MLLFEVMTFLGSAGQTPFLNTLHTTLKCSFKGTVPQDFRLQVIFTNQLSPNPLSIPLGLFRIFVENSQIYSQLKVASLVLLTPVANVKNLLSERF
jgi:hypothetical protein